MLDLLLLGTGAMVPLPDRALSSLLVRSGGRMALFDCGEGTQVQMRRFHWGFRNLDAICLSHLHADHVLGLPGLFHTVANAGRTEPMFLYGPVGTNEVMHGLRVVARYLPFELVVRELADGDEMHLPGGMRGTVAEASHRIPCLAWRVDIDRGPAFDPVRAEHLAIPRTSWSRLQRGEPVAVDGRIVEPAEVLGGPRDGIAFGFVTDTRPTTRISSLIEGVDLLVCESTYALDEDAAKAERHGHMTLRQACELAAGANAGRLWLTHFGGGIDNPGALAGAARNLFPQAEPGYAGLSARLSFEGGYVPLSSQSNAPVG